MCGGTIGRLFVPIRNAVESAASLAGNYLLPGSSLLTNHLVSKGSQEQLGSTLGRIAQIGSGLAGGGVGSSFTGIPAASEIGAGWTNAANAAGGLVGAPTAGTSISNSLGSLLGGSGAASATGAVPSSFPDMPGSIPGSLPGAAEGSAAAAPTLANADAAIIGAGAPSTGSGFASLAAKGTPAVLGGGGTSSYLPLASAAGGAYSLIAGNQAKKDLTDAGNAALTQLAPYNASGVAANAKLSGLLGTGANTGTSDFGSLTKPFTPGDLTQDPGYQFNKQQGELALDRKAAAGGSYFSGGALKDAQTFGQGLADNTYNNAFSRYLTQNNDTYNKLAGATGTGLTAANAAGNIQEGIGNSKAGAGISTANTINSTLSSLLNGSGAKRPVNIGGQVVYI